MSQKNAIHHLQLYLRILDIVLIQLRKSIEVLVENKYISIRKEGRKNVYKFNPYKNFEPFSDEFLESDKLETNEKAYMIAAQQFLIKDQKE